MRKTRTHDWKLYDRANRELEKLGLYPSLLRLAPGNKHNHGTHWALLLTCRDAEEGCGVVVDREGDVSFEETHERRSVQLLLMRTLSSYRYLSVPRIRQMLT